MDDDTPVALNPEEAFMATFDAEPEVEVPLEPADEQAPAPDEDVTPEVEVGTTDAPAEDSFRGFDETLLSTLPPELQAAVTAERKSIQGEATRKFQEAAELRKQFDGVDPELARNAVAYMERLSDPDFLKEAHQKMTEELERLGLSPQEAQAQAATVIADAQDEFDLEDEDSVNPRVLSELNELKSWKADQQAKEAAQEEATRLSYLTNEALKQETALRQANPDWSDADITSVINLGWVHKGDLIAAGAAYRDIEKRVASRLLADKASIPGSVSPPPNGGGVAAESKHSFGTDLEGAHKAAEERLRNILAGG